MSNILEDRYSIEYDLKGGHAKDIRFMQGAKGTAIVEVTLYQRGSIADITGESIEFRFEKPDGNLVYQDSTTGVSVLDALNGRVECVLEVETLQKTGRVLCQIVRRRDGKELPSPSFAFTVETGIGEGGLSTTYIKEIESKLNEWQTEVNGIKSEYTLYKNVMIAESNVAALQNQINNYSVVEAATGTGTAILVTLPTLLDGCMKTFVVKANNGGAATTINGKPLYKPSTVLAPNLTIGKAVTVWYNLASNCFFIKASAEGNSLVGDVLAGKTFSTDVDTGLVGTMVNRGAVTINTSSTPQLIAEGYHNGLGVVNPIDSSSLITNINLLLAM